MAQWTRADLLTLVGQCEIYALDDAAGLVSVPAWLVEGGAVELTQSLAERMELIHPSDRAVAGDMFLRALASPGEVVTGEYRVRSDDRWFTRSTRMVNLAGEVGLIDGTLVVGHNTTESSTETDETLASSVEGEFRPADWLVEILDDRGAIIEIEGMVEEIWGCPPAELIGSSVTRFLAPESFTSAMVMWTSLMASPGHTASSRQRVIRPDGSSLWIDSFLVSRVQPDGTPQVMNFIHDVSEQHAQQVAIEQLAEEFRSLADQVPAAIFRCDRWGTITFHNELLTTICAGEVPERVHDLVHTGDRDELDAELARLATAPDEDRGAHLELRGDRGDAMLSLKLRAVGQPGSDHVAFVGSVEDITSTMTLRRRATHDPLTGLMNRDALAAYLGAAMLEYPDELLVGFVDLDGFKTVNDTFDHEVGDQVLASIAERLRRAFRSDDVVARYGGDEFVVVCRVDSRASDVVITSGVARALVEPVVWDGGRWAAQASIGIARVEPDDDVADLLRRADRAMYLVKAKRRLDQAVS